MYKQNKCTNKIIVQTKYVYKQNKCTIKVNLAAE